MAQAAYDAEQHPLVLVDEAHHESYTLAGRYRPFAELLTKDGYQVKPNRKPFDKESLAEANVLVIADPLGSGTGGIGGIGGTAAGHPAFTAAECDAVYQWVQAGGALLLVADPAPAGRAAAILAKRFGVEISQGETFDPEHSGATGTPTAWIPSRAGTSSSPTTPSPRAGTKRSGSKPSSPSTASRSRARRGAPPSCRSAPPPATSTSTKGSTSRPPAGRRGSPSSSARAGWWS